MTLADIICWFATRSKGAKPLHTVLAKCGDVRAQLDHLEQLGILYSYRSHVRQDSFYVLRVWEFYQPKVKAIRRAA